MKPEDMVMSMVFKARKSGSVELYLSAAPYARYTAPAYSARQACTVVGYPGGKANLNEG